MIMDIFRRFIEWFPLPSYTKQRPLCEWTKTDMELAFRFAPEHRAEIVNRGSMSRNEFIKFQRISLERLDAELDRRGYKRMKSSAWGLGDEPISGKAGAVPSKSEPTLDETKRDAWAAVGYGLLTTIAFFAIAILLAGCNTAHETNYDDKFYTASEATNPVPGMAERIESAHRQSTSFWQHRGTMYTPRTTHCSTMMGGRIATPRCR